jgi:hypothetical protein
LNGEIERLGKQVGVPTPKNSTLLQLVNEMASQGEVPGKHSPAEMGRLFANARQCRA